MNAATDLIVGLPTFARIVEGSVEWKTCRRVTDSVDQMHTAKDAAPAEIAKTSLRFDRLVKRKPHSHARSSGA